MQLYIMPLRIFFFTLFLQLTFAAQAKNEYYLVDTSGLSKLNDMQQMFIDSMLNLHHHNNSFIEQARPIGEIAGNFKLGVISTRYNKWLYDNINIYTDSLGNPLTNELKQLIGNCYHHFGIQYYLSGELEKSMKNYLQAIEIREEFDDFEGLCRTYNNIGVLKRLEGNFEEALINYEKVIDICGAINLEGRVSAAYNNMANILITDKRYNEGLEYLFKAVEIKEKLNDKEGMAVSYNGIGRTLMIQEDFEEGLLYYRKALKLNRETGDKRGESGTLSSIGNYYLRKEDYNKALEYMNKAKEIAIEDNRNSQKLAHIHDFLGKIYQGMELEDKALEQYYIALEIFTSTNQRTANLATVYSDIGLLELRKGNVSLAEEMIKKGYDLAQELGNELIISEVALAMSTLAIKQGNYKLGYEYSKTAYDTKDSIKKNDHYKELVRLQYNQEYKNKLLEKDLKIKSEKDKADFNRKIMIGTILFATILLFMSYFLIRLNSKLKKQKLAIETERQRIAKINQDLLKKNEIINQQKKALDETNRKVVNELKRNLLLLANSHETKKQVIDIIKNKDLSYTSSEKKILKIMNDSHNKDIIKNINFQFIEANKPFAKKLGKDYPDLTQNNIMLCLLIKLQLETKEIANILYRTPDSIKVAKSRLRKRFGLTDGSTKLFTFLSNYD